MMRYIDADANPATGWCGHNFLVNRTREGKTCSLERYNAASKTWVKIAMVPLQWADNQLTISIPRETLGAGTAAGKLKLDFKWVDNIPVSDDIMDFYDVFNGYT
ncbi:MAG: hypothetical protein WCK77_02190 [Verrucomicrobiota bacterium]